MRKKWIIRATFQAEDFITAVRLLEQFDEVKIEGKVISSFFLEEVRGLSEKAKNND